MNFNTLKTRILILLVLIITSCQEKFNGKSKKDFKISKEKVEKKLNADEKIKLEKAIRVIALKAMILKWDESNKYKGKSFNDIALELVDGLSYSSVTDLAEDFLQERNKKEAEKLSTEINKLEKKKTAILSIQKQLNLFKIESLELNETDWFGEMSPRLEIEYKYIGKADLKSPFEISIELKEINTKHAISIQSHGYEKEDYVLKTGESVYPTIILEEAKERNPHIWKNLKYPIKNPKLSDYNLDLKTYVSSIYANGKKIIMPKIDIKDIETELKNLQSEYNKILKSEGTLDELELTDK